MHSDAFWHIDAWRRIRYLDSLIRMCLYFLIICAMFWLNTKRSGTFWLIATYPCSFSAEKTQTMPMTWFRDYLMSILKFNFMSKRFETATEKKLKIEKSVLERSHVPILSSFGYYVSLFSCEKIWLLDSHAPHFQIQITAFMHKTQHSSQTLFHANF